MPIPTPEPPVKLKIEDAPIRIVMKDAERALAQHKAARSRRGGSDGKDHTAYGYVEKLLVCLKWAERALIAQEIQTPDVVKEMRTLAMVAGQASVEADDRLMAQADAAFARYATKWADAVESLLTAQAQEIHEAESREATLLNRAEVAELRLASLMHRLGELGNGLQRAEEAEAQQAAQAQEIATLKAQLQQTVCIACQKGQHSLCLGGRCECIHGDAQEASLTRAAQEIEQLKAALRSAWEEGFRLCRSYGDNHAYFEGDQKERQWRDCLERLLVAAEAGRQQEP